MIIISIKQHLSNNRGSIHENIKPRWGWVEKKALLIKKSIYINRWQNRFIFYKDAFTNIKEAYLPHSENLFHLCMKYVLTCELQVKGAMSHNLKIFRP